MITATGTNGSGGGLEVFEKKGLQRLLWCSSVPERRRNAEVLMPDYDAGPCWKEANQLSQFSLDKCINLRVALEAFG